MEIVLGTWLNRKPSNRSCVVGMFLPRSTSWKSISMSLGGVGGAGSRSLIEVMSWLRTRSSNVQVMMSIGSNNRVFGEGIFMDSGCLLGDNPDGE